MGKIRNKIIRMLGGIPNDIHKQKLKIAELEGSLKAYRTMFKYINGPECSSITDYYLVWSRTKSHIIYLYNKQFIFYDRTRSKYATERLLQNL